jgi:nicotinamide-nucleotide amidase
VKAAILSIGDELLAGSIVDSNAAWIGRSLTDLGCRPIAHRTVGDDREAIAAAAAHLAPDVDVLVCTGGLGPTADDLTRYAVADLVDAGVLIEDEAALDAVRTWCETRGLPASEARRLVAMRPPSARFLTNDCGTAPGMLTDLRGVQAWWLPGPPQEMRSMFNRHVAPEIRGSTGWPQPLEVLAAGLTEVQAADRLGDLLDQSRSPRLGIRVGGGLVRIAVRPTGSEEHQGTLAACAAAVRAALEPWALPAGAASLPEAVAAAACGERIAVAESCTAGGIAAALTSVAGSSDWFVGGWVTYADAMKVDVLGVPSDLLSPSGPGAVSSETAAAMASQARVRSDASLAAAVTGIAGPGGGTTSKPVGTVWLGLADAAGVRTRRIRVPGDRHRVRAGTTDATLQWIRWHLLGVEGALPWEWPTGD